MKKTILKIVSAMLIIVLLALLIPAGLIGSAMGGRGEPGGETLIVLGTTVNGTEPSPMLKQRLDAAAQYLNACPNAQCIVTGGKGDAVNLSEAQCMYNYLTAAGIDGDRITMEDRATSTVENLRYVRAMQNQTGAAVSVHSIADGQVEAMEFRVDKNTKNCGIPLKQLKPRPNVLIASISHGSVTEIPNGDSVFHAGDIVVVVTTGRGSIRQLNDIFA